MTSLSAPLNASTRAPRAPRAPRAIAAIVVGLIGIFLISAVVGLTPATRAAFDAVGDGTPGADSPGAGLKAVIIVGPTHDLTAGHLVRGENLAKAAEAYGMDVRRVFHPKATWANVLANIQGANLVAYFGHGNGWPSPYGPFQEKTKNGFGLNPFEGAGRNKVEYYGANKIRKNVVLASDAVVLLNHLCYSAGNGESGMAIPSWSIAHQRVDNFAAGFLFVGAGAVFAYRSQSVATVLDRLMTTDQTMQQIFSSVGYVGWDPRVLASARMPGFDNLLDPHKSAGFERAVSGKLSMSAGAFRNGTASDSPPPAPSGDGPDITPPSTPTGLTATALGYRRISLSWNASTDDRAGPIRYRIFRNGTRIAQVTDLTSFVDRPASAGTYKYKVRALDAAGNKSAFSGVVTGQAIKGELSGTSTPDITPPSTPTGLTATALGYRRISLSWNASTDDRAGPIRYRIFRNGTRIAQVTDLTSFVDRPASAGTYKYKVRALDAAGNKSAFSVVVNGMAIKGELTN